MGHTYLCSYQQLFSAMANVSVSPTRESKSKAQVSMFMSSALFVSNRVVQAQLKRTEIDVQQMIQDRVKKVEEIKQCVELNKVSPPVTLNINCKNCILHKDYHASHVCVFCLMLFAGQRSERGRGKRAGLLGAGALHPEDSGRAGSVHRGEAEADGEVGRQLRRRAGAGDRRAEEEERGLGVRGSDRPHSLLKGQREHFDLQVGIACKSQSQLGHFCGWFSN